MTSTTCLMSSSSRLAAPSTRSNFLNIAPRLSQAPLCRANKQTRLSGVVRVASPDLLGPPGDGELSMGDWRRAQLEAELQMGRAAVGPRLPPTHEYTREQLFHFGPAEVLLHLRHVIAHEYNLPLDTVQPYTPLAAVSGGGDVGPLVAAVDRAFRVYFPLLGQDWAAATVSDVAERICADLAAQWN